MTIGLANGIEGGMSGKQYSVDNLCLLMSKMRSDMIQMIALFVKTYGDDTSDATDQMLKQSKCSVLVLPSIG